MLVPKQKNSLRGRRVDFRKLLDEIKLIIPEEVDVWYYENFGEIKEKYKISEIEENRIKARLVLIQISEHLEIDLDSIIMMLKLNKRSPSIYATVIYNWLDENYPDILKWYFK